VLECQRRAGSNIAAKTACSDDYQNGLGRKVYQVGTRPGNSQRPCSASAPCTGQCSKACCRLLHQGACQGLYQHWLRAARTLHVCPFLLAVQRSLSWDARHSTTWQGTCACCSTNPLLLLQSTIMALDLATGAVKWARILDAPTAYTVACSQFGLPRLFPAFLVQSNIPVPAWIRNLPNPGACQPMHLLSSC